MRKFIKQLLFIAAASISAVAIASTRPNVIAKGIDAKDAAPSTYYSSADTASGTALASSLHEIIYSHTDIGYSGLWNAYKTTDVKPGTNYIWDMYFIFR